MYKITRYKSKKSKLQQGNKKRTGRSVAFAKRNTNRANHKYKTRKIQNTTVKKYEKKTKVKNMFI